MLTVDKFLRVFPRCKEPERWVEQLNSTLPQFAVETPEQIAQFLAQTGHESAEYNIIEENLNYSLKGLRQVFPKYFPDDNTAFRYARQPKHIASRVYANRMGNGGEASGDGWKYRGRGLIQLTGKNNYYRFSMYCFDDDRLLETPDDVLSHSLALKSACWFWELMDLNSFAHDTKRCTKLINGGYNGLAHRVELYERALRVIERG